MINLNKFNYFNRLKKFFDLADRPQPDSVINAIIAIISDDEKHDEKKFVENKHNFYADMGVWHK